MPSPKGQFIWHDLISNDPKASLDFYSHVVGWTSLAMPSGEGGTYHVLEANKHGMGGIYQIPEGQAGSGMKPGWVGYIGSDDVDADLVRLRNAGGTVHRPAEDIPEVGRFAPVSDPQGAGFLVFKPRPPAGKAPVRATGVGTVGWAELSTTDWKAAFAFYSELFGWKKDQAMDMGPMGTYQLFTTTDGPAVGAMMNRADPSSAPGWLYYFNVDAIDAAAGRVKAKGGAIQHGPVEVPGGLWIVNCRDAQGSAFALVAPKR